MKLTEFISQESDLPGSCRILPQAGRGGSVPPFNHRAHVTIEYAEEDSHE